MQTINAARAITVRDFQDCGDESVLISCAGWEKISSWFADLDLTLPQRELDALLDHFFQRSGSFSIRTKMPPTTGRARKLISLPW